MDYSVLILSPPRSMTENVSTAKWAAYNKKFFTKKPRKEYRQQKLQVFHRLPEVRTSFTTEQSQFHIDRLQRSPHIMLDQDYVRVTAHEVVTSFRGLVTSTAQQQVLPAPPASTSVASLVMSPTHHFQAPTRRLVPVHQYNKYTNSVICRNDNVCAARHATYYQLGPSFFLYFHQRD